MEVHNKQSLLVFRRELRQRLTPWEELLWECLRARKFHGAKFKRQHSIGNYILDFYCAKYRLIIELDGMVHREREQAEKDKIRDKNLEEMNYTVLRFWNFEVENNMKGVLKKIQRHICSFHLTPSLRDIPLLVQGEGPGERLKECKEERD